MIRIDNICALATPAGMGAIAVIRISGPDAFTIAGKVFYTAGGKKKNFTTVKSHTLHFGTLRDGDVIVDEVLLSVFKSPHSYTSEDTVEISCHGSVYIQQQVLQLLYKNG